MPHIIGYWAGSIKDRDFIFPQELGNCNDPDLRQRIVSYLEAGDFFTGQFGYSACRFDCGVHYRSMGSTELTDGFWAWPKGLAHYVEHHHIELPQEFLNTVSGKAPGIPNSEDAQRLNFWIKWSLSKRTQKNQTRIQALRIECEKELDTMMARYYLKKTKELGESEVKCDSTQCSNFALINRTSCARHLELEHEEEFPEIYSKRSQITSPYTEEFRRGC